MHGPDHICHQIFEEAGSRAPKNSIWAPTKKFTKNGLPVIYCFGLMHDFYIKVKKSPLMYAHWKGKLLKVFNNSFKKTYIVILKGKGWCSAQY